MTNSDYLLKAAIKKVTEKLNDLLLGKIEEATNIAQDAPEIIKKEFEDLKESIIEEAAKMQYESNFKDNQTSQTNQDPKITLALEEIGEINKQLERINKEINKLI